MLSKYCFAMLFICSIDQVPDQVADKTIPIRGVPAAHDGRVTVVTEIVPRGPVLGGVNLHIPHHLLAPAVAVVTMETGLNKIS